MADKTGSVGLTFVNYNYAFANFYENYKNQCIILSEKTKLHELRDIKKIISAFIYEYDYTIRNRTQRIYYSQELKNIKERMDNDETLLNIMSKDFSILANKMEYYIKYYEYFLLYLSLMGKFTSELTVTFMPNTNIQKKLIKFSNNQAFFEKFTQHKKLILDTLVEFNIRQFIKNYNRIVTFYYAYNLFINNEDRQFLDQMFSLILSIFLSKDNLSLIILENPSTSQLKALRHTELLIHNALLYCNSKMNQSFSNYDVLPKLQNKIYFDRTLI